MLRRGRLLLLALATLLAAPAVSAGPGDGGVLHESEPYATGLERGPDEDGDGYPTNVTILRERLVLYQNGLTERKRAEPLVVTVDEHDRDPTRPIEPSSTAPVPTGYDLGSDGDRDGVPDSLVIRREYPSLGTHRTPAPPLVVPLDPDPSGSGETVPHVEGADRHALAECGSVSLPSRGAYCARSGATLRWKHLTIDGPSARASYDLDPLGEPGRPSVRVHGTALGHDAGFQRW